MALQQVVTDLQAQVARSDANVKAMIAKIDDFLTKVQPAIDAEDTAAIQATVDALRADNDAAEAELAKTNPPAPAPEPTA